MYFDNLTTVQNNPNEFLPHASDLQYHGLWIKPTIPSMKSPLEVLGTIMSVVQQV